MSIPILGSPVVISTRPTPVILYGQERIVPASIKVPTAHRGAKGHLNPGHSPRNCLACR